MNTHTLKEEYVWQLPVRFYHWINALCIVVLACTGYLIGRPVAITSGAEASFGYWFGTVRFIHFVTAFVFFFNFAFQQDAERSTSTKKFFLKIFRDCHVVSFDGDEVFKYPIAYLCEVGFMEPFRQGSRQHA